MYGGMLRKQQEPPFPHHHHLQRPSGCYVLFNQHSPDILLTKATPGQDSVSKSEEATVTAVCQQWRRTELLSL